MEGWMSFLIFWQLVHFAYYVCVYMYIYSTETYSLYVYFHLFLTTNLESSYYYHADFIDK